MFRGCISPCISLRAAQRTTPHDTTHHHALHRPTYPSQRSPLLPLSVAQFRMYVVDRAPPPSTKLPSSCIASCELKEHISTKGAAHPGCTFPPALIDCAAPLLRNVRYWRRTPASSSTHTVVARCAFPWRGTPSGHVGGLGSGPVVPGRLG